MDEELKQALNNLYHQLESSQVPLEPEFQKVLDDNFWDLLIENESSGNEKLPRKREKDDK